MKTPEPPLGLYSAGSSQTLDNSIAGHYSATINGIFHRRFV